MNRPKMIAELKEIRTKLEHLLEDFTHDDIHDTYLGQTNDFMRTACLAIEEAIQYIEEPSEYENQHEKPN